MSQSPPPFVSKSTKQVLADKRNQTTNLTDLPFVVLLDVKEGVFRVTPAQREKMARNLNSYGISDGRRVWVDPEKHTDVFAKLHVEESTPKLLLFWRSELQQPVWLVNPEEPDVSGWIKALRDREGFPPST